MSANTFNLDYTEIVDVWQIVNVNFSHKNSPFGFSPPPLTPGRSHKFQEQYQTAHSHPQEIINTSKRLPH